jgi:hypothetical protein
MTIAKHKDRTNKTKQAYDFFIGKGYTPEQASGIVGNLLKESNLNTTAEGDIGYSGGSSFGIAQWRGERLKNLQNKYGNKWRDFNSQLEFIDWELNNTELKAGKALKNSKNVFEAGAVISDLYERPKVKFNQDVKRQKFVIDVYKSLANSDYKEVLTQEKEETLTTDVNNLEFIQATPIFAGVPDVAETEEKDKDIEEVKQQTAEYNFLQEIQNSPERETLAQEQPQQRQQTEAPNYLEQYEQISQFIDSPIVAQQGGTWQKQQEKVKAEKLAKLRELLKDKDIVKNLEKEAEQRRSQSTTERTTTQADATKTARTNNPDKTSLTARNKTDKEIAEERQVRIDAQEQANAQPFDWNNFRQSLADRSQATGDALRISNEPNFFDDYLNPASMIGSMADNLGQAPLRAQQEDSYIPYVTAVGTPLAVGALAGIGTQNTGQFVNNLANPLAGTGNMYNYLGDSSMDLPKSFLDKLKNKKASIDASDFIKEDLLDPETIKRATDLGLDPEILEQAIKNLTVKSNPTKSYYNSTDLELNISPNQIGKTPEQEIMAGVFNSKSPNFTANEVGSHETGHFLQDRNFYKEFDLKLQGVQPTKIDEMLEELTLKNEISDYFAQKNKKYFSNPTEKYPFFREYRQGMRDSGILKNKWDEITPEMVDEFYKIKPESRLNTFMELNDKNKNLLREVSKIAPVVAPAIGTTYLTTQTENKQQGGNIIPSEIPDPINGIIYDPNEERTRYDSRLDRIILTPQSNFAPRQSVVNHEKYHKYQYDSGRSNFDIAHNTENQMWAKMQKRPQLPTTDSEYYTFHNRKALENELDVNSLKQKGDFRFIPNEILYNKILDRQQYENPYSLEGEATQYERSLYRQQGGEYTQAELDFLSEIAIKDNEGYRNPANKNKIVEINSPSISMKGIKQPILAISKQTGEKKKLNPEQDYIFKNTQQVIEIPFFKK